MPNQAMNLMERSVIALKWSYLGVLARIVLQFISQLALARILGPEVIGVFSMAILVVGIGGILVEMGLGAALVQRRDLTESEASRVFNLVVTVGLIAAAGSFLLAPHLGEFYGTTGLTDVLRGLAPVFLFQALSVVPIALLKRDLAFKAIQVIQTVSYAIGYMLVGIGAALAGAGVWSLVFAAAVQTGIASLLLLIVRPHPIRIAYTKTNNRLSVFGSWAMLTNLINWAIENIDNILIGKFLGASALGLYAVPYNLTRAPANHLVTTVQTVLFPASAIVQDSRVHLQRAYLLVVSAVAIIAFPVFAGIAACSGTLVEALLGPGWSDAASLLPPLALAMVFHTVMTGSVLLWATDQVRKELRVQVFALLVTAILVGIGTQFSIVTAAWAVSAAYFIRSASLVSVVVKTLGLSWRSFVQAISGAVVLATLIGVVCFATDWILIAGATGPVTRLVTIASVALSASMVLLVLLRRWFVFSPLYQHVGAPLIFALQRRICRKTKWTDR